MCYPGIIMTEQVDDFWKPDIYIDGIIDGVRGKSYIPDNINNHICHFRQDTWQERLDPAVFLALT